MKGKLSLFQRTMLLWNKMHPYNAVHVVRIPQPLEISRLTNMIHRQLRNYGLTGLVFDKKQKRFEYDGGSIHIGVKVIKEQEHPLFSLCKEIQDQLNTPFLIKKEFTPFRFFAVSDSASFYLGLVYFHPISDGVSIVFLFKSIVKSYMDREVRNPSFPINLYPGGDLSFFTLNPKYIVAWIFTLPGHIANIRKSFRPRYADINDQHNGFYYFTIDSPEFHQLIKTARKWEVTLNDLFLAMMMKSLSPFASKRIYESRRKKISLASIMNIREDLSIDKDKTFGLFLGFFNLSHRLPEGVRLEQLAKDLHKQTEKIKNHKLYLRTILEMGAALFLISSIFSKRQKKFYSKYYPIWGGLSNMNLNTLWEQSNEKQRIDYFRAVSTGPVSPLVFSITTVNDVLNVSVSFKTTVFSQEDVERIAFNFSNSLSNS